MAKRDAGADTETISEEELAAIRREELPRRGTSLLAYHRDAVRIAALEPDRPLIVGRAPMGAGDLVIDDESLSREHAQFTLKGDTVTVVDLASRNGLWCLGERVKKVELFAGDEVRLGKVPVLVHGTQALPRAARPLRHETFRLKLDDEVQRAGYFARPLSLLMVRAAGAGVVHVSRFHARVSAELRRVDRMAFYSPDTLEIVLPEMSAEDAVKWAKRFSARVGEHAIPLVFGVATYPDAARDVEALVEKCRDALTDKTRKDEVCVAPNLSGRATPVATEDRVLGAATRAAFEKIRRVAKSTLPILILGETGVGKEVLARRIHAESPRASRSLVVVNCAAIPETLVEGTLFGHERGAFTGAAHQARGLFEGAHGGTLMLDEIGDLPSRAQGALLRVLESGMVRRVGAMAETAVDVRILAATHRDLNEMVAEGTFRADLLHRLSGERVTVPPLRERRDEIPSLCESFVERANLANARAVARIADDAATLLREYSWPGNVRELRNTIERAVVLCESETIILDDLPESIRLAAVSPSIHGRALQAAVRAPAPLPRESSAGEPPSPPLIAATAPAESSAKGIREQVTALETSLVLEALRASRDNRAAAELLGLPLRTFVHKMAALGITRAASFQSVRPRKQPKR